MAVNNIAMFNINDRLLYREYDLVKCDLAYLFVCIDKNGQRYIVIDLDRNEFLIAGISAKRLLDLINGRITMRTAFTDVREVFHVISGSSLDKDIIVRMPPSEVPEEDLPDMDSFFEKPDDPDIESYIRKLTLCTTAKTLDHTAGAPDPSPTVLKVIYRRDPLTPTFNCTAAKNKRPVHVHTQKSYVGVTTPYPRYGKAHSAASHKAGSITAYRTKAGQCVKNKIT